MASPPVSPFYTGVTVQQAIAEITSARSTAEANAASALAAANSFMDSLGNAVGNIAPPIVTPNFIDDVVPPNLQTLAPPALADVAVSFPSAPAIPDSTVNLTEFIPQAFDADPPTLVIPGAPALNAVAPGEVAVDLDLTLPVFEEIIFPAPPELLDLNVRQFDGVTIPAFNETVSELDLVAPFITPYSPTGPYTSTLLDFIRTEMQNRVTNGGTGLPASVEGAIWDRTREREAIATREALDALDEFESQGFALPPGSYADARLKISTEMNARTIPVSREIAIEQAKLEQKNIEQAIQGILQIEGNLMQHHADMERFVFEAARYATQAAVDVYNAQVGAYEAFLRTYEAKVQIYRAQIDGEIAQIRAYEAEMNAERAKAEVNVATVQVYRGLIDAALANVQVFEAEVRAVMAKADLEKTKVQLFGEQIRAYAAEVSAYSAEVEGHRNLIQAQGLRVEAYSAEVNGFAASASAKASASQAVSAAYKAEVESKTVAWEGYKARSDAAADQARIIASQNAALIEAYRAENQGFAAYQENLTQQWQVSYEQAQRTVEIGVAAANANAQSFISMRSLALDAAKVGAQVTAQLAASALNTVNYTLHGAGNANLGHDISYSEQLNIQG